MEDIPLLMRYKHDNNCIKRRCTDFGDLTYEGAYKGGFSSQVRAVIGGGMAVYPATPTDQQDAYIMASTGTVTNFGNLTVARHSPMEDFHSCKRNICRRICSQ